MKYTCKILKVVCLIAIAGIVFPLYLQAQDPAMVDSTHHKVILENDQVRILRVTYAPNEKGTVHNHPNSVAVFLTDAALRITQPDGKTVEITAKPGQVAWSPATTHTVENAGEKAFELIHIDIKCPVKSE